MGKRGSCGHDIVDEEDCTASDPFGFCHGKGIIEIVFAGVSRKASLVFGVANPTKSAAVRTTVESFGERDGEQGALVVATLPFTTGMKGNGNDDVDGGEIQLRTDRTFKQVHEIVAQPGRLPKFEVLYELIRRISVEDGAAGEFVGRRFRLADFADEVVPGLRRDESTTDSTGATPFVERQRCEAVRTDMASIAVGRAVARFDCADPRPDQIRQSIEESSHSLNPLTS